METVLNEIEVSYRPKKELSDPLYIYNSSDAFKVGYPIFDQNQIAMREEFVVIYLNRANRILGYSKAFTGGINGVVCDPRIILAIALKGMASSIILMHNHPSGNLKPSEQDKNLTKKINAACEGLDIYLMDHLIVTDDGKYLSLRDEGMI